MIIRSIFTLALSAFLVPAIGLAQTTMQERQDADLHQHSAQAGKLDKTVSGNNVRASELIGMNIQNSQDENVGEISDIVLDTRSGKINYVAVTYGGFLGVGNSMHAVPYKALKFKADPDDTDSTLIVLNVTQEQLEGSEGFDENNWPNFADRSFTDAVDQRYGVDKTYTRDQSRVQEKRNREKMKRKHGDLKHDDMYKQDSDDANKTDEN